MGVGLAMVVPFAASVFYFVLFSEYFFARVIYAGTKVFTLVWPVISVWLIFRTTLPKIQIALEKHRKAIPLGIILGIAIVLLMLGLMQTPLGEVVTGSSENIRNKARELGILEYYWSFALFLSLIHSLIEEYYWRWFVFGHLREVLHVFSAHLLAGISFAAHHVIIATQFFPIPWGIVLGGLAGAGGILWSVMYDKQQTLMGAWICHVIVDLGILAIGHNILFGSYVN